MFFVLDARIWRHDLNPSNVSDTTLEFSLTNLCCLISLVGVSLSTAFVVVVTCARLKLQRNRSP